MWGIRDASRALRRRYNVSRDVGVGEDDDDESSTGSEGEDSSLCNAWYNPCNDKAIYLGKGSQNRHPVGWFVPFPMRTFIIPSIQARSLLPELTSPLEGWDRDGSMLIKYRGNSPRGVLIVG